jgi:hypothetical protein
LISSTYTTANWRLSWGSSTHAHHYTLALGTDSNTSVTWCRNNPGKCLVLLGPFSVSVPYVDVTVAAGTDYYWQMYAGSDSCEGRSTVTNRFLFSCGMSPDHLSPYEGVTAFRRGDS